MQVITIWFVIMSFLVVQSTLIVPPPWCVSVCVCSNGTGRTGAFIGLSVALEHVRTEGMVDVYGIVKNLRTQRPHMVQTLVGFSYITQPLTNSNTHTHAHTHKEMSGT